MEYGHIDWIIENYGEELMLAVEREGIQLDPENVLCLFIDSDPSQKKTAVDWMVKTYIKGGFLLEDLQGGLESKVCETIGWFAEHRKKIEKRNLSSYSTLAEVYTAIQPFIHVVKEQTELSGKALKRREKEEVFEESILLRKEDNLLLAVPLTKRAAQWWGKGTRWCTAATKSDNTVLGNMFDHYNENSPLVVMVFPRGLAEHSAGSTEDWEEESVVRKFQIWVPLDKRSFKAIQFMDEMDNAVTPEFVQEHWSAFEPVIRWAFEKNFYAFKFFPKHTVSKEMALDLVKYDRDFINSIPEDCIDQEIVNLLVSGEKHVLSGVPEKFLTPELCNRAFSASITNIKYIRDELQTREMCQETLAASISYIQYLNTNLLDNEMIVKGLHDYQENRADKKDMLGISFNYSIYNNNSYLKVFYKNLPQRLRTGDILELLSVIDPKIMLEFESDQFTREMAKRAIMNNSASITKIPNHLWDDELINLLVEESPDYIRSLDTQFLSKDIVLKGLNNPKNEMLEFSWIPKDFIDKELIRIVVNKSSFGAHAFITDLPKNLWDQEVADIVLQAQPNLVHYVPKQFVGKDFEVREDFKIIGTKGKVMDELFIRKGISIMDAVQSFGRGFRAPRPAPEIEMLFIDENHGQGVDDLADARMERKWDESSLNGLRIQEIGENFKPK